MGLFDGWTRRRRVSEAAEQMWGYLKCGINFEVPLLLDKNDLTLAAIAAVQKKHPQVQLRMYQSRGMVLGLFRGEGLRGNVGISDGVLNQLQHSGHIGEGYENIKPEDLLAEHERWARSQHLDIREEERLAQEARAKREGLGDIRAEKHEEPAPANDGPGTEDAVPIEEWAKKKDPEKTFDQKLAAATVTTKDVAEVTKAAQSIKEAVTADGAAK